MHGSLLHICVGRFGGVQASSFKPPYNVVYLVKSSTEPLLVLRFYPVLSLKPATLTVTASRLHVYHELS